MKIAVVTDDKKNISAHFGRAQYYMVLTVEDDKVTGQETRSRDSLCQCSGGDGHQHHHHHGEHGHGSNAQSEQQHNRMANAIQDCEILLARGMGQGAHISLRSNNIKPVLTDIQDIREAVDAYLAGKLVENPSRVH